MAMCTTLVNIWKVERNNYWHIVGTVAVLPNLKHENISLLLTPPFQYCLAFANIVFYCGLFRIIFLDGEGSQIPRIDKEWSRCGCWSGYLNDSCQWLKERWWDRVSSRGSLRSFWSFSFFGRSWFTERDISLRTPRVFSLGPVNLRLPCCHKRTVLDVATSSIYESKSAPQIMFQLPSSNSTANVWFTSGYFVLIIFLCIFNTYHSRNVHLKIQEDIHSDIPCL